MSQYKKNIPVSVLETVSENYCRKRNVVSSLRKDDSDCVVITSDRLFQIRGTTAENVLSLAVDTDNVTVGTTRCSLYAIGAECPVGVAGKKLQTKLFNDHFHIFPILPDPPKGLRENLWKLLYRRRKSERLVFVSSLTKTKNANTKTKTVTEMKGHY